MLFVISAYINYPYSTIINRFWYYLPVGARRDAPPLLSDPNLLSHSTRQPDILGRGEEEVRGEEAAPTTERADVNVSFFYGTSLVWAPLRLFVGFLRRKGSDSQEAL